MSINFHMEYHGVDVAEQGPRMKAFAEERGVEITTLGYYCLEHEDHLRNLEKAIDCAHLYGARDRLSVSPARLKDSRSTRRLRVSARFTASLQSAPRIAACVWRLRIAR